MTLELDPERRQALADRLQRLFADEFDENLTDFRAEAVIDMMIKALGPQVYNQAVQDVRAHLQLRLDDLDGEIYLDEA